ncbi:hypothetical protein B1987_09405 [Mycobacterium kansasii]|uniref:Transmembrane protein n=1 Tax=Mycobacterium attenuatum TaxID=2341086 RepID=A0A498QBJ0_9MYCO|nr:DUF2537 domain-containing protein [Mycobacterium attenuatum]ORB83977.1 hypothetical protein B1987_09405 [Mycobacterium kansasii]VBA42349.1 hypothetical protein LAUMK136_04531 [Mycobacterium attenuatum]VBA58430.1 hypothetical protein LAUMK191_04526 [Mycobacterium attenuatum]VBA61282.1 hypothetical protein LAUMK41_04658 [Mycobacterium attenuatum]
MSRELEDRNESVPWATGLVVAGFVAAATGVGMVVLSLGLIRVHALLAVGLNIVAVGGLAPTLWGWRRTPVLRWFVLGAAVGVAVAWLTLLAMAGLGRA